MVSDKLHSLPLGLACLWTGCPDLGLHICSKCNLTVSIIANLLVWHDKHAAYTPTHHPSLGINLIAVLSLWSNIVPLLLVAHYKVDCSTLPESSPMVQPMKCNNEWRQIQQKPEQSFQHLESKLWDFLSNLDDRQPRQKPDAHTSFGIGEGDFCIMCSTSCAHPRLVLVGGEKCSFFISCYIIHLLWAWCTFFLCQKLELHAVYIIEICFVTFKFQ